MKAISIIVPVYEVEKYIINCLNSIYNQTFLDFELIIIDDCGTDDSMKLAKNFLDDKEIDFTIIRNKKNVGLSGSRNAGIEISKGNYFIFIDSDDWIEETMLEDLYQAASASNSDIVSFNAKEYWEEKNEYRELPSIEKGQYSSHEYLMLLFDKKVTSHICFRMFKSNLFSCTKFPEQVIFEDFLTFPYLVENANSILQLDKFHYNYLQRDNETNITASRPTNVRGFMMRMKDMELHFIKTISDRNFKYLWKYEFLLLAFMVSNLFKSSTQIKDFKEDVKIIRDYLSLNKLIKTRKITPKKAWLLLLMLKINGRAFFFMYKNFM